MTIHAPIPDFAAARAAMVDSQLRPQGVNEPAVLDAMAKLPREQFVPEAQRAIAYVDRSISLGGGRYLGPPTPLGLLLTQIAPRPGQRALVVGAGTGYSAAVLAEIGLDVVALESSPELAARARELGLAVVEGPLEAGHKDGEPFDILLIDGAVEYIPDALVDQLKDGGVIGATLIDRGITRLIIGRKAGGSFGSYSLADAAVPPLPGFQRPRAFTF